MQSMRSVAWKVFLLFALLVPVRLGPFGCGCNLAIVNGSVPDGIVGVTYSFNLNSQCGGDTWFIQQGNLPPGIGLQSNGDLRGTPTQPGIFTFTVGVFDFGSGDTAFKGFSLTVAPAFVPTPTPGT